MALVIDTHHVPQTSARTVEPDLIVLHWTAGGGEGGDVARYFLREVMHDDGPRRPRASYNYVVDRHAARVAELVPPHLAAWHAGDGGEQVLWDGSPCKRAEGAPVNPVNDRSIGIALANRGPINAGEGLDLRPRKRGFPGWQRFEPYPWGQIMTLRQLLQQLLKQAPTLRWICGHEDVTKGKGDPGPAFPWDQLGLMDLGLARMHFDWARGHWTAVDAVLGG